MTFLILQRKQGFPQFTNVNTYSIAAAGEDGLDGIAMNTDGTLWVSDAFNANTLRKFDPSLETVVDTISVGADNPRGLVFDENGDLWVAIIGHDGLGSGIRRYNITTHAITRTVNMARPWHIDIGGNGWIWAVGDGSSLCFGMNPSSGSSSTDRLFSVTSTVTLNGFLADSNGNVWAAEQTGTDTYTFYNFSTDTPINIIPPFNVQSFAEGNDGFVYGFNSTGTVINVMKFNMTTGAHISTDTQTVNPVVIDYGRLLTDIEGKIWVGNRRYDPLTLTWGNPIFGLPTTQSHLVGGKGTVQHPTTHRVYSVSSGSFLYEVY